MTTRTRPVESDRSILISIRSRHVASILSGIKSVEFRRRGPYLTIPTTAVIYSSGVDMSLRATTTIARVTRLPVDELWSEFSELGGIDRRYFDSYFAGCTEGYALLLASTDELSQPVALSEMRSTLGLTPPQSWCYINGTKLSEISALGSKSR